MDLLLTSPWIPVEWIKAHGFVPRGVWALADHARVDSPEGVCAFARTAQQLREGHPKTLMVFTTACDQIRRAADPDTGDASPHSFLFNLPATWQTNTARQLFHAEVQRLGRFLQRLGGRAPTASSLSAAIREHNEHRSRLRRWHERGAARQAAQAVMGYFNGDSLPDDVASKPSTGVPLALIGGPLCASQWGLFDTIEGVGGCVVLDATEPGERCVPPPLPTGEDAGTERAQDLRARLCDHYFDHVVDVFQRPNSKLYDWLGTRLKARNVRGIVLWVHVGCDLWRAEAASLRETFGLPVLVLDSPDVRRGSLRDANRLAAFVESLR